MKYVSRIICTSMSTYRTRTWRNPLRLNIHGLAAGAFHRACEQHSTAAAATASECEASDVKKRNN